MMVDIYDGCSSVYSTLNNLKHHLAKNSTLILCVAAGVQRDAAACHPHSFVWAASALRKRLKAAINSNQYRSKCLQDSNLKQPRTNVQKA